MRGRRFTESNAKLDTMAACLTTVTEKLVEYQVSRVFYARALAEHGRSHFNFDVDEMAEATDKVDEARVRYINSIAPLKTAHREYKTAFRAILTSKII